MIEYINISHDVPITDPQRAKELDQVLKEFGFSRYEPMKAKWQELQAGTDEIDGISRATVFTELYLSAIIIFLFGNLAGIDDIVAGYHDIWSRSAGPSDLTKISWCIRDLLPLPEHFYGPSKETIQWVKENRDKLSWDEALGKYVLKSDVSDDNQQGN